VSQRVLVLAPHADDETLGLGGTIAKRVKAGDAVTVCVLTGHGPGTHPFLQPEAFELVRAECAAAMKVLGVTDLRFRDIPAVLVTDTPVWQVNQTVRELIDEVAPDELFVPFPYDLHGDHRSLFHAASVAWRPVTPVGRQIKRVVCYEVLSETHWNAPYLEPGFLPNSFETISDTLELKLRALECFKSQMRPFPDIRSVEAIKALAQLRGSQVGVHAAEAFVIIRELR